MTIQIKEIEPYLYEIPRSWRQDMRVPARFFATPRLLKAVQNDRSLEQLVNTTTLPGIVSHAIAMPDIHQGYGFPIGGVVATEGEKGVVSPGGVGYDINCGVRALVTPWKRQEISSRLEAVVDQMYRDVPAGFGRGSGKKLSDAEMEKVLENGAQELVGWGFGTKDDIDSIESQGRIPDADTDAVSDRAKERGRDQLGSLGSGNHFLEVQFVEEIYDPELAQAWGLEPERVVVMIHTGSRGVGHQNCTDHVRRILQRLGAWGIELPDRELACAPLASPEGQTYMGSMAASANFAFANRQMVTFRVRKAWEKILGKSNGGLKILYDVAHNIAKFETHTIDGKSVRVLVHRKGATRAFPKNHPELPERYRALGQPVIIPGTMGTASYVLVGTQRAMERSFGTVCHGAGRSMSRQAAKRQTTGEETRAELKGQGITVRCHSNSGLAEEAPMAYKDVDEVVRAVDQAGLAKKVARLRPIAVIKGG